MTSVHALIGVGEGVITALVLAAVNVTRPELLQRESQRANSRSYTSFAIYGSIVIVGLLIFVAPFASPLPDVFEKVARFLGFEDRAVRQPLLSMPFAAYRFPGISSLRMSTVAAGAAGMLIVFILSVILAYVLYPNQKDPQRSPVKK